ncbi:MAG: hypothetical protein RI101_08255 [Nitrospira sp.]|jgi:hypothetical protein|nr:hypothetical protein [Nitrospira sp.]
MRDLDLHHIRLVVKSAPEMTDRFRERVTNLFLTAGLSLYSPAQTYTAPTALLKLTLYPAPLGDICPTKVLYTPSIVLIEPVLVPRNSEVMQDITWSAETSPQARPPLTIEELEQDLDWLIWRFIKAYQLANSARPQQKVESEQANSMNPHGDDGPSPLTPDTRTGVSMHGLSLDRVQLSVVAGRLTPPLATKALRQFRAAGLSISLEPQGQDTASLSLEMTQRAISEHCPGKVFYKAGLFLVEQVTLIRNQRIRIWSDTWAREHIQIAPPVSLQQFESDQESLLGEFIRAFQAN